MKTHIAFGLYLAVVTSLLQLVVSLEKYSLIVSGALSLFVGFPLGILILYLGMKKVRSEQFGEGIGYGRAVGTGMLIAFFGALFSAVYSYAHFSLIDPTYFERVASQIETMGQTANLPEEELERNVAALRATTPGRQAVSSLAINLAIGLLVSLILALVIRRKPSAELPPFVVSP